jgi:hypothetical protein
MISEPTDNRRTESQPSRPPFEKPEKYTIPVLVALLGLENSTALRIKLGIKDTGFWSRICSDIGDNIQTSLPQERYRKAIELCEAIDPPVKFTLADFRLPKEKLIDCISRKHPLYEAARAAAGLPLLQSQVALQSRAFEVRSLLPGSYARFLIARSGGSSNLTVENLIFGLIQRIRINS